MKEQLSIIPRPVSIEYRESIFLSPGLPLLSGDDDFHKEIETVTVQLRQDMEKTGGVSPDGGENSVICKKVKRNAAGDEAYRLVISEKNITIEAASAKGMYHGLQTYRQLVLSEYRHGETFTLPCLEITDYPRFSWRGLMLDCSRHFYAVSFIKRLIDVLSLHHINRFHWHLTDDQGWRLPVAEYPLLTEIGSRRQDIRKQGLPYTGGIYQEDEIREVVAYAASRHIEIIPEVDLPGHTSAILASYPGLGCTGGPYRVEDRHGIFDDVLCAGNDQIFDLAANVFNTLDRLFPSSFVHIGGDEVRYGRWQACPKCQKRLEELGLKKPEELQSWITGRLVQMLAERGKTAIGWDEILDASEKYPLPKETAVMSWRGNAGGIRAAKLGHPVIMSPNTKGCYLDYKQSDNPEEPGQMFRGASTAYDSYTMDPVTPEMTEEESMCVLGGQGNLWSELIYADKIAEYMIFPRLCAIAEAVWTPREGKDFEDFSRRLTVHRKRLDRFGLLQYRGPLR